MSHHSDVQPRRPKGSPEAGEWAPTEGEMASFDLRELDDAEYNADGSFEYPPAPRSAAQVLAFWARVPVPDSVLEKIRYVFDGKREMERAALEEQLRKRYRDALPPVKMFGKKESSDPEFEAEVDAAGGIDVYVAAVLNADGQAHPAVIREDDVRTVARASQAWWQSAQLAPAEREKVLAEPVFLNARGGHTITVGELEDRYQLNRADRQFRQNGLFADTTRWVGDQVEKLQATVNRIENWVGPSQQELYEALVERDRQQAKKG